MKKWSTPHQKFLITTIGILALITIFLITTSSVPDSSNKTFSLCPAMTEPASNSSSLQFHPIKIVAEPWRGEHHVYAIFALPLKYKDIYYRSKLRVKGSDVDWYITITDGKKFGASAPEGHYLVIGFFRTRLALWYWLRGRFADLQQPCNWTLYFFP